MAADKITLDRIELLHPKVRKEVYDAYMYVNEKLLPKGVRLRFAYTLRTNKEQSDLYAQGRTVLFDRFGKRLGKVTNANAGQSIHNYGLAFDIVILFDRNNDGVFETASWNVDGYWMKVINYFKSIGWSWGGDWNSFKDYPHMEKTFGHTWRTLKDKMDNNQFIDAGKYSYPDI
jgi:peptidoglycan L-alanyl-D-glutamate endopeptidase CwlK